MIKISVIRIIKLDGLVKKRDIKLKDINERVFIETFIGNILVFINYFVVRKLVNTTGEEFLPNYNTEGPKYIVLLTWIVFSVIVSISLLQIVLKSKIYKSQGVEGYERSFYRGKLFNKFIKITISIIFYITLYQIIFQLTMKGINIKINNIMVDNNIEYFSIMLSWNKHIKK